MVVAADVSSFVSSFGLRYSILIVVVVAAVASRTTTS